MGIKLGTISNQPDYLLLEPGNYRVRVRAIEPFQSQGGSDFGPAFKWTFDLIDPADADLAADLRERGQDLTAITSAKLGVNSSGVPSKLRAWAQACIGRELLEGEDLTDDMILGKVVDAVVEQKVDGKNILRSRIEKLVAVRAPGRRQPAAAAAVAVATPPPAEDEGAPF